MKFIKAFLRATIGAALIVTAFSAKAQIPTTDAVALTQRLLQIQNAVDQLTQMKSQVQALTGNSGIGMALNNPALRSYLPDQWESVYNSVKSGNLQGLSSATTQILQQEGLANGATPGQQRVNNTLAANKAMAQSAYDASIARLQNIQSLMQQSTLTQSASEKADLNNRMQAEMAMIQNEQTRLNMMTSLQQAETALAQRQAHISNKNALLGLDASGNPLGSTSGQ
jgi:type IV secretion system protein VirB5